MTCRRCGAEIAEKAIVCYRCGAPSADPVERAASTRPPRSKIGLVIAVVVIVIAAGVIWFATRTP